MSLIYISIEEKVKTKTLHEGNFSCPNCRKITLHKLFSIKRDLKIYGLLPFGRLEYVKVLQCQECGLEKELNLEDAILGDELLLNKSINELLSKKIYTLYNKNIKECSNCGSIIGNVYELSRTNDLLVCNNCGNDLSDLLYDAKKYRKNHSKNVIIVLIIIGAFILLSKILEWLNIIE